MSETIIAQIKQTHVFINILSPIHSFVSFFDYVRLFRKHFKLNKITYTQLMYPTPSFTY